MIRTITALVALFSVQAFACPNLAGTYTCTYSDGQSQVSTISQREANGITYYTYDNSEFPADGTVLPMEDSAELKQGTFKAWCSDAMTLKNQIMGKYWNNGSEFGDLDMIITVTKAGENLSQVVSGNLKAKTGAQYPINQNMTCTKN